MLVYHKIIKSGWIVLEKSLDNPAGTESNAFDADSNILFLCTFAYFTHMLTEYRLYSIPVTALQLMCSGRMGILFMLAHSAAVFSLKD